MEDHDVCEISDREARRQARAQAVVSIAAQSAGSLNLILRKPDVELLVGLCDRQIRRLEACGHFPKRFPLTPGGRVVGWRASDVQKWIADREAA